jgi:hypothetical protein
MAKASAGGGGASWALAVVALLVMVGFLAWLAMTSEPSVPVVIQEDPVPEALAGGTVVSPADFEASMAQYMGQEIQLNGVVVASKMTPQLLWIELPGGTAFPVKTDSLTSLPIPENARVTVVGRVYAKTDSVLNAWQQAGALRTAGDRAQAEFGTSFIEARTIRSGN